MAAGRQTFFFSSVVFLSSSLRPRFFGGVSISRDTCQSVPVAVHRTVSSLRVRVRLGLVFWTDCLIAQFIDYSQSSLLLGVLFIDFFSP